MESSPEILVADIGGTHARFAIARVSPGHRVTLTDARVPESRSHAGPGHAIRAYAADRALPAAACFALAGPVKGGTGKLTNLGWSVEAEALKRECGFSRVLLVNDFAALGAGVSYLEESDLALVKDGKAVEDAARSVMGAGTGFGATLLAPASGVYVPVPTESGHISFAPTDAWELRLVEYLMASEPRISVEMLLSGPGLSRLHRALRTFSGKAPRHRTAVEIGKRACEKPDSASARALEVFCNIFGSVAGDLALSHGARGGVYLAGGVLRKNQDALMRSAFAARFTNKGPMSDYARAIPVFLIRSDEAALKGAALWFAEAA
jgi:glucokinase